MEQATTANDLRQRGNFEFSAGHYDAALSLYTAALEACSKDDDVEERILNLCNRSAVYYIQEEYDLSKADAETAWNLSNQTSVKAAYRLAKTALQLRQYDLAKRTIQAGLRVLEDRDVVAAAAAAAATSQQQQQPSREKKEHEHEQQQTPLDHPSSSQRKSLQDLWKQVLAAAYDEKEHQQAPETSIKYVKRPISIKEFSIEKSLGHGNFSEIVTVQHKVTHEKFALKKIEKKQAADLYKRQHPNVYNEIQMERRVLLERLPKPGHPFIIKMYHAFQDYNTLYYLMDLHTTNTDLWSQLRYKPEQFGSNIMIGCHRSTAKLWLYELVDALEFLHRAGIVHRDLKPENVLLDCRNRVVLIDFGTAKDLLQTDLNGPEFVGTPDFMSPEAVSGKDDADDDGGGPGAGFAADLWALGAVAFILMTGHTPYWSPSPYMAFLKIKRAAFNNLTRPMGIIDDDCWDLVHKLMRYRPEDRLGANVFTVKNGKVREQQDSGGYDILRQHPYFADVHNERSAIIKSKSLPIPSLLDLCIRATAEMAYQNSQDLELCDRHPPGDGSKYDLLRLGPRERAAVLHCLDRRKLLSDPRLYARFFASAVDSRLDKIRPNTRDVVGLTQMNDDQGKPPKAKMNDQYAKPIESGPIQFVHLTNPLLLATRTANVEDEVTQKKHMKLLKKCVANINRTRPKMVVVAGKIDDGVRKILARISETIPVVVHDGSAFFTFWLMGVQCIALQSSELLLLLNNVDWWDSSAQIAWLREQLEQVRLSKHPLYVFVDCDPRRLPLRLLKKLAQGRTLCVFGLLENNDAANDEGSLPMLHYNERVDYKANDVVDDASIRSTESEEDAGKDNFSMQVKATCENGLRWITVEEEPDMWSSEFKAIELPPPPTES